MPEFVQRRLIPFSSCARRSSKCESSHSTGALTGNSIGWAPSGPQRGLEGSRVKLRAWLLSTPQLGAPPMTLASEFPLGLLGIPSE